MKICSACGHALTPDGPCGFASITVGEKTTYLCHADDHSCYMAWRPTTTSATSRYLALPDAAEGTGETDSHDDPGQANEPPGPASDAVRDLAAPLNGSVSSRPSPGADPRLKALVSYWDGIYGDTDADWSAMDVLAAADAADKAAGIIRVDLVELLHQHPPTYTEAAIDPEHTLYCPPCSEALHEWVTWTPEHVVAALRGEQ